LRGEGIEFQTVHIPALFKALTEMMSPSLISRNLKLKTLADLSSVQGDETLLLSLLTNLVENAAKASKSDDTITVRTYEEEGPVLEVKDTGYGMEKQEIEKITAPFYCVDKSRSRKFGGAGLGLSIVAQIVDLHKAKMEIDSSPGQGTTIRIRFKLDH
jgi:signal transduction histidine kinase